jgi:phosphohistidine phosphatase
MRLLLIRHAAAVPSGTPGLADDDRPLTPRGRARFERAAQGLARIADRPDVLLTSPLPRARATAEIAARAFGRLQPVVEPALAHGTPATIVAALARQPAAGTIAVVGHEPTLGSLLARLLEGEDGARLAFKKGGAALVDLPGGPRVPGRLVWFLKPRILRALAAD